MLLFVRLVLFSCNDLFWCTSAGGFDSYKDTFPDEVHVPELVVDPSPILSLNLDDPISATIVSPSPHYSQDQNHPQSHIKRILSIKPSMILPCLYIGSRRDACDKELLKSLGITNIINATDDCPCHFDDDSSFEYLRIPVKVCKTQFKYTLSLNLSYLGHMEPGSSLLFSTGFWFHQQVQKVIWLSVFLNNILT